jgi:DUF1009 family protein
LEIAFVSKLGLIAGNGRFPFLLLDAARAHGEEVVVAALKEETDPEMDARAAADPTIQVNWLSLGELSRLIEIFQAAGVTRAVMAGQVKHKQIFSSIRLLGAVAKVLGDEGIELISSTSYLEPLLAKEGVLTTRSPNERELLDVEYGRGIASIIAAHDIGQTVVVAHQACVAVEAMEGTDATILRAGEIMKSLATSPEDEASTLERSLTVIKVAKPKQDLRFDVPVIGVATIEAMRQANASCLSLDAGRTLIFDEVTVLAHANSAGIAIVAAKIA